MNLPSLVYMRRTLNHWINTTVKFPLRGKLENAGAHTTHATETIATLGTTLACKHIVVYEVSSIYIQPKVSKITPGKKKIVLRAVGIEPTRACPLRIKYSQFNEPT